MTEKRYKLLHYRCKTTSRFSHFPYTGRETGNEKIVTAGVTIGIHSPPIYWGE